MYIVVHLLQGKLNLSCVSVGVPQDKYFFTKNKLLLMKPLLNTCNDYY